MLKKEKKKKVIKKGNKKEKREKKKKKTIYSLLLFIYVYDFTNETSYDKKISIVVANIMLC